MGSSSHYCTYKCVQHNFIQVCHVLCHDVCENRVRVVLVVLVVAGGYFVLAAPHLNNKKKRNGCKSSLQNNVNTAASGLRA